MAISPGEQKTNQIGPGRASPQTAVGVESFCLNVPIFFLPRRKDVTVIDDLYGEPIKHDNVQVVGKIYVHRNLPIAT